jgi:uncharacterized protein (DUF4415 family)
MRENTLWEKLHAIAQEEKRPPVKLRQTVAARLARKRLMRHLEGFTDDEALWWKVQREVPQAWATVEEDIETDEPRVKVTLYLDQSVARLFRAMGKGWHDRINRILATYAQMRMGEVERERQDMQAILDTRGLPVPEALTVWYLEHRAMFEKLPEREKSALDTVFGVLRDTHLDNGKNAG